MRLSINLLCIWTLTVVHAQEYQDSLELIHKIEGHISPKSIVASGNGYFFAQNMMYRHTITVYDSSFNLVKTIRDKVKLKDFGYSSHVGEYKGAPVECAFSHNGKYAWVSNYNMTGGDSTEFVHPGCDGCYSSSKYDSSYLYKINTSSLVIENVVRVGSVPKFLAVSPDNSYLLCSNWSSGDVSVIDLTKDEEIKRIKVGPFPRGIAIDSKSEYAYVAVMGKEHMAKISLNDFSKSYIENVGDGPRHVCIDQTDSYLYVSLNSEGKLAKLNLKDNTVDKYRVGHLPRSMVLSKDDRYLYVVNYGDDQLAKVDASTMEVLEYEKTADKPIGVTVDTSSNRVWVACYSGKIMVFEDSSYLNCSENTVVQLFAAKDTTSLALHLPSKVVPKNVRKGTTQKEKNKNTNSNKDSDTTVKKSLNGSYFIVAGSFSKPQNAKQYLAEVKKDFPLAFLYKNNLNGNTYVCLNSYENKEIAIKNAAIIKENGVSNWVFTKK